LGTPKSTQDIVDRLDHISKFVNHVIPAVNLRTEQLREKQKSVMDEKRNLVEPLKVGQLVMFENPQKTGKFDGPKMLGPVLVKSSKGNGYILEYADKIEVPGLFSIERLKIVEGKRLKALSVGNGKDIEVILNHQDLDGKEREFLVQLKSSKAPVWVKEDFIPKGMKNQYFDDLPGDEDDSENFEGEDESEEDSNLEIDFGLKSKSKSKAMIKKSY